MSQKIPSPITFSPVRFDTDPRIVITDADCAAIRAGKATTPTDDRLRAEHSGVRAMTEQQVLTNVAFLLESIAHMQGGIAGMSKHVLMSYGSRLRALTTRVSK